MRWIILTETMHTLKTGNTLLCVFRYDESTNLNALVVNNKPCTN